MDNPLGFEEDTKSKESEVEWGTEALQSVRVTAPDSAQLSSHQNLYVIPQKTVPLGRPIIPATLLEKLSFYRAFAASSSKIEIMCMQQSGVNRFIWFYVTNLIFKSVPMTYVYVFLSSYSPHHHFFLPKMVPIFYGFNWIAIVAGRFLLQKASYHTALLIHYTVYGLLFKVPWNRCISRKLRFQNHTYTCMELDEFSKSFTTNITYFDSFYMTPSKELFILTQIEYYDQSSNMDGSNCGKANTCVLYLIVIFIWILAAASYGQIFKRYIWKTLHFAQMALCVLLFSVFIHLILSYEESKYVVINIGEDKYHRILLQMSDFDLLAESTTAPPVTHVLSSRTTTEIKPSLNSAVIVLSNGIYYIFKALTTNLMKTYCQRWVNATIIYWNYGSGSFFYFWPIYFATVKHGAIFVIIFFALNAIVEYSTFLISFQCLVEAITREWRWIRPWCASGILAILAILEISFFTESHTDNHFIFWVGLATLIEVSVVFIVYALGRFVEDITFHYGIRPTKLRVWSFRILRFFYPIKIYLMLEKFYYFKGILSYFNTLHRSHSVPTCVLVLLAIGAVYAVYKWLYKEKKSFLQLLNPVPEWGPKDYWTRQLRKEFDDRDYIGSQGSRDLNRYLIEKADLKSYKLDLRYDNYGRRRSTHDEREERHTEY